MTERIDFKAAAKKAIQLHYPDCDCAFVSGSILRGEGTQKSDIDIVVLYNNSFDDVHRNSVLYEDWPIEFFVHNPGSLSYYFEQDKKGGMCTLAHMVKTAYVLPQDCPQSRAAKKEAENLIRRGPDVLSPEDIEDARYFITDLLDDIDASRPQDEQYNVVSKLYGKLGDFYLRVNGSWSGSGKWLGRRLKAHNKDFAKELFAAVGDAHHGCFEPLEKLAGEVLAPYGGRCFDGYKRTAPKDWKPKQPD